MRDDEFNGEQRPANEGGRFDYYECKRKREDAKGCGCVLVVIVLIAALIAGIAWLLTGAK